MAQINVRIEPNPVVYDELQPLCADRVRPAEPFAAQYKSQRTRDYIMLQGHPAMWSDESFESFKRILDCLEADGWTFTTHSGYQKAIK